MNKQNFQVDFAISYAGEDSKVAEEVARRLRELGFCVFFAGENRMLLIGIDGEAFFERLFSEAKEVVVFISQHYKRKIWTRFEWDIFWKEISITDIFRFALIRLR